MAARFRMWYTALAAFEHVIKRGAEIDFIKYSGRSFLMLFN